MHLENSRMPGTSGRSNIPRTPYEGKRRLCNMVDVRFEHILQTESFDCGELIVRPGSALVVQTPKGPQIARAVSLPRRELIARTHQHRVIRHANPSDIERADQLAADAKAGVRKALMCVREHRLPMKLVAIEYMLDRSRALVYFTSEQRVDFRALVRDLAKELRVRIEMRQIGVRDGAGIIGGIGPCGHELCCSSFLRSFRNVSIRAPKSQGITLNPQRITGMCGRLKCCLLYEKASYAAAQPFAPRRDRSVLTVQGPGSIVSVDALSRTVYVRFPGGSSQSVHMRDLIVLDVRLSHAELQATMTREEEVLARRRQRSSSGHVADVSFEQSADDYLWDDLESPLSFFGTAHEANKVADRKKNDRASRAQGRKSSDASGGRRAKSTSARGAAKQEAGAQGSGGKQKPGTSKRRRRRRRKSRKPASAEAQAGEKPASQGQGAKRAKVQGKEQGAPSKSRRRRRPKTSGTKPPSGESGE